MKPKRRPNPMTSNGKSRVQLIDDAISAGASLIAALMEVGPVNPQQGHVIIMAAVRAAVPNAEFFEVADRARLAMRDLSKLGAKDENLTSEV